MNKLSQKKKILLILALVLVSAGGAFAWFNREPKIHYRKVQVERGDLEVTILATGTVLPENRLEIKPPVAGRVEEVLVKEGEVVKKGQIIAWMSSSERASMIDAARSQGPAEVKKWEELYRPTPVVAPLGGTIILRSVESGQTFTATDAILVMSDRLTVKAQVDETDIAKIKVKQVAHITLDAYPEEKIRATVDQIAYDAKAVNNVTTYVVDVLPEKTPEFMRSGMTANVTFELEGKKGILLVPNEAIKSIDGRSVVYVANEKGKPVETEIKTGITNGKQTELLAGADEGATLLIEKPAEGKKGGSNPFNPMGGGRPGKKK